VSVVMGFKLKLNRAVLLAMCACSVSVANAAEWKSEPSVFMKTQYNDNVRMRADKNNPEGSSGYTLEPRVKFAGEELRLWDMAIDTRAKITRYQDIEDGDSENLFFKFDGGRQTELTDWRLSANYSKNTNFDTDFDTTNPDLGIGDRTERTTISAAPSVLWNTSETSQIRFSLKASDVTYGKVTNLRYKDYTNNSVDFSALWMLAQNHQLGFTSSYSEYDSPDTNFSYNQTVLQLDYTYTINPLSDISVSLGGRSLDSLRSNVTTSCIFDDTIGGGSIPPTNGQCPDSPLVTPVIEDLPSKDTGTVTNIAYTKKSELSSHRFTGGRTISPSSFGGANEIRSATYQFSIKNTERFTTKLLLSITDSETVSGTLSSKFNDRTTYRFEPSVSYNLTKNWKLQFLYRYLEQDFATTIINRDAASNAVFVNLYLHWPKLVTTY
jgi:hypothetical protein